MSDENMQQAPVPAEGEPAGAQGNQTSAAGGPQLPQDYQQAQAAQWPQAYGQPQEYRPPVGLAPAVEHNPRDWYQYQGSYWQPQYQAYPSWWPYHQWAAPPSQVAPPSAAPEASPAPQDQVQVQERVVPVRSVSPAATVTSAVEEETLSAEDLSYQKKMLKVCEGVGLDLPRDPDFFQAPVLLNEPKARKPLTVLPIANSISVHFNRAWDGATKLSGYEWSDDLTPPQNAIKLGKRSLPPNPPKIKYYATSHPKLPDVKPEWPMGKVTLDSNATLINPTKPGSGWDSKLDDWMESNGRMLKMLNQVILTTEASTKLLKDLAPDPEDAEAAQSWSDLSDFTDIANTTLQHLASVSTNLQVNLLLAKRDEVLQTTKLADEYKQVLRYTTPKDKEGRLFSGKLFTFDAAKSKIEDHKLAAQVLAQNKRKSSSSGFSEGHHQAQKKFRSDQGGSLQRSYASQPFRDSDNKDRGSFSSQRKRGSIRKRGGKRQSGFSSQSKPTGGHGNQQ